ncbi:hypothetical protein MRX96_052571 [Rhipicephalus microplus]
MEHKAVPPDGFPIAGPSTEGDSWRLVNPDMPSQTYSYNHHVVETYKNMLKEQEARLWHRFGRLVNQLLDEEQEPLVQLNLMKIKEELREAATTALQPGAERRARGLRLGQREMRVVHKKHRVTATAWFGLWATVQQ